MVIGLMFMGMQCIPVLADHDHHMPADTITLDGGFWLDEGETRNVRVSYDWRYVKNIFLRLEAQGQSAWVNVYANGTKKGNAYVPGRDPSYLVTIGEAVRTIQLQHGGGGRVWVGDIKATVAAWPPPGALEEENPYSFDFTPGKYPDIDRFFERNMATSLAQAALAIVGYLRPHADPEMEYVRYLLPIKIAAARVLYIAQAHGVLGEEVRPALEALVAQVVSARPYTDSLLKKDSTFELGVRLLALKEKIKDLID
jgi:hypothetical protein